MPKHYRSVPKGLAWVWLLLLYGALAVAEESYLKPRQAMIDEIRAGVEMSRQFLEKGALDERVLEVMRKVPRHRFVPEDQRPYAYDNRPLPIGYGQTISQPYIVAVMTDLLNLGKGDRVLEIGTGSGYQAAILAELTDAVFTIEIIEELGRQAGERLEQLNYDNVRTLVGDGYYGWPSESPFDAIVVTAAASHIPPPLIKQLKPGGRMIIPVGSRFMVQHLVLVTKDEDGELTTRQVLPVSFVPLTGEH
jgi:protein-L-isoaspartate(D-aspartate) O-methyltransferase